MFTLWAKSSNFWTKTSCIVKIAIDQFFDCFAVPFLAVICAKLFLKLRAMLSSPFDFRSLNSLKTAAFDSRCNFVRSGRNWRRLLGLTLLDLKTDCASSLFSKINFNGRVGLGLGDPSRKIFLGCGNDPNGSKTELMWLRSLLTLVFCHSFSRFWYVKN